MVVLRLTRVGKKKQAQYRVVVADSRRFVNSKFIEIVGTYNPHTKETILKKDEIAAWLAKGAQPSNTVAKLLVANGVKLPDWAKIKTKAPKVVEEPKTEEKAEETAEVAEEVVEEVVENVEDTETTETVETEEKAAE